MEPVVYLHVLKSLLASESKDGFQSIAITCCLELLDSGDEELIREAISLLADFYSTASKIVQAQVLNDIRRSKSFSLCILFCSRFSWFRGQKHVSCPRQLLEYSMFNVYPPREFRYCPTFALAFGRNNSFNLGLAAVDGPIEEPRKLTIAGETICEIAMSQKHTLFLTDSGKVYACGFGADYRFGRSGQDVIVTPVLLEIPTTKRSKKTKAAPKIVDIACGKDFSVLISSEEIFVCGKGSAIGSATAIKLQNVELEGNHQFYKVEANDECIQVYDSHEDSSVFISGTVKQTQYRPFTQMDMNSESFDILPIATISVPFEHGRQGQVTFSSRSFRVFAKMNLDHTSTFGHECLCLVNGILLDMMIHKIFISASGKVVVLGTPRAFTDESCEEDIYYNTEKKNPEYHLLSEMITKVYAESCGLPRPLSVFSGQVRSLTEHDGEFAVYSHRKHAVGQNDQKELQLSQRVVFDVEEVPGSYGAVRLAATPDCDNLIFIVDNGSTRSEYSWTGSVQSNVVEEPWPRWTSLDMTNLERIRCDFCLPPFEEEDLMHFDAIVEGEASSPEDCPNVSWIDQYGGSKDVTVNRSWVRHRLPNVEWSTANKKNLKLRRQLFGDCIGVRHRPTQFADLQTLLQKMKIGTCEENSISTNEELVRLRTFERTSHIPKGGFHFPEGSRVNSRKAAFFRFHRPSFLDVDVAESDRIICVASDGVEFPFSRSLMQLHTAYLDLSAHFSAACNTLDGSDVDGDNAVIVSFNTPSELLKRALTATYDPSVLMDYSTNELLSMLSFYDEYLFCALASDCVTAILWKANDTNIAHVYEVFTNFEHYQREIAEYYASHVWLLFSWRNMANMPLKMLTMIEQNLSPNVFRKVAEYVHPSELNIGTLFMMSASGLERYTSNRFLDRYSWSNYEKHSVERVLATTDIKLFATDAVPHEQILTAGYTNDSPIPRISTNNEVLERILRLVSKLQPTLLHTGNNSPNTKLQEKKRKSLRSGSGKSRLDSSSRPSTICEDVNSHPCDPETDQNVAPIADENRPNVRAAHPPRARPMSLTQFFTPPKVDSPPKEPKMWATMGNRSSRSPDFGLPVGPEQAAWPSIDQDSTSAPPKNSRKKYNTKGAKFVAFPKTILAGQRETVAAPWAAVAGRKEDLNDKPYQYDDRHAKSPNVSINVQSSYPSLGSGTRKDLPSEELGGAESTKPLEYMECEERAISELEQMYRAQFGDEVLLDVVRVHAAPRAPVWNALHGVHPSSLSH